MDNAATRFREAADRENRGRRRVRRRYSKALQAEAVRYCRTQARAQVFQRARVTGSTMPSRSTHPGHGPRPQPTLPTIEIRHELAANERQCPACGGELTEMIGQAETAERITTPNRVP